MIQPVVCATIPRSSLTTWNYSLGVPNVLQEVMRYVEIWHIACMQYGPVDIPIDQPTCSEPPLDLSEFTTVTSHAACFELCPDLGIDILPILSSNDYHCRCTSSKIRQERKAGCRADTLYNIQRFMVDRTVVEQIIRKPKQRPALQRPI